MKKQYAKYRTRWNDAYTGLIHGISSRGTIGYIHFIQMIDSTATIHDSFGDYFQAFNDEIKSFRHTKPTRLESIRHARTLSIPKLFELQRTIEACESRKLLQKPNPLTDIWLKFFRHCLWGMTNEHDRIFLTCLVSVAAMSAIRTALIDYAWRFTTELAIVVERHMGEPVDVDMILSNAYMHPTWLRVVESCRREMSEEGLLTALRITRNLRIRTFKSS